MTNWKILAGGVAIAAMSTAFVAPAMAQVTSSTIKGMVVTEAGAPVAGASVLITHVPTGTISVATTNASGNYGASNLRIGGPFTVEVSGPSFDTTRAEGVYTNLGDATSLDIVVGSSEGERKLDVVVVSGSALQVAQVATGPSATFNLDTLENAPAMNRDIKDILRIDPRIYVDEAFNDAISCAGASPRFNSLTVDGVRLNDNFGLNSNGYPTERIPFSYDSIQQVSVELAPFDVNYGSFTACNINAVTKSGTNEFHGGAFFDFTSDQFTGDRTEDTVRDLGDFEEKRYGFNVGGPIIQDKLFFFGSYEKFEGANIFGNTPADVGLSDALYQSVIDIAVNQYGYVSGGLPTSLAVEDEKIFAKLDWNITNNHRASFTYNYNDGNNFSPSDSSSSQIADGNHYYQRGAELKSYTGTLYSDWTDALSTELRVSYLDLQNTQIPVAGLDNFGEVQIRVPNDLRSGTTTIYLGADDSRHANQLSYDLWNYKAAANYSIGNHVLTAGVEREEFSVFNLFIQQVQGEWRFSSPNDFANGDFNYFQYTNAAGSNDQNDGAADFGYEISTIYGQDQWQVTDKLDITAGLRYDYFTSGDKPAFNQTFFDKYGFGNDSNMDGRDLLQPRLGFNYEYSNDIKFHGGIGLYSGGNPNVWISNNYSNNGVTLADYFAPANSNLADFTYPGSGNPFIEVPQEAIDAIANANGVGGVNALDPDFKLPSEWKFALGTVVDFGSPNRWIGDDWRLQADFLYSKVEESAVVVPIGYVQSDTAPDGRPIYGSASNTNDFLLTNADDKGRTYVYSVALSKDYGNGIDWSLGYAYTDAKDTNPMTSSVAFSNFSNFTTSDPVNITTATSDYEIAHRITMRLNMEKEFVQDFPTRLSVVGTANEGAPYSYTFGRNSLFESRFTSSRQLAYIPTGVDDPLISPLSNAQAVADLIDFINSNDDLSDMKGSIADRNGSADDWWTKFDLKLTQDLPGLRSGDKTQAFLTIENLGNLLNDDWGLLREHGFPGNAELYNVSGINNGQYVISSFNSSADSDSIVVSPSLWQIHFGLKYEF